MRDSTQSDYYGPFKKPRFIAIPFIGSRLKRVQPSHPTKAKNLKAFVREHLQEPDEIRQLAQAWEEWAQKQRAPEAHASEASLHHLKRLDHRHVSVQQTQGQLSLGVAGSEESESESESKAQPHYQHPQHQLVDPSQAQMFPAFVIYLSLLALAENPKLWKNYCLDQSDDLLFSVADFRNPAKSSIFRNLRKLPQPIPRLNQQLKNVCLSKYPNIPSLILPQPQTSEIEQTAPPVTTEPVSLFAQTNRPIQWRTLCIEILEMMLRITLGALSWLGTVLAVLVALPVRDSGRNRQPAIATPTAEDLSARDVWAD